MTNSPEDFIQRILSPREQPPWWQGLSKENRGPRSLQAALEHELGDVKPPFGRTDDRRLNFFSTKPTCAIDGIYGERLGVELKLKDLSFDDLIDGIVHRCLVWVFGKPPSVPAERLEAVGIYVVRRNARKQLKGKLLSTFLCILGELRRVGIYLLFVQEDTGKHWRLSGQRIEPPPDWMSNESPGWTKMPEISMTGMNTLAGMNQAPAPSEVLFGRKPVWTRVDCGRGENAAWAVWKNHWQMMEVGLLLRAKGHSAVKVSYIGPKREVEGFRSGVEREVRENMVRQFGVLLDWGVEPL